jgi:hypothetical protein
MTSSDHHGLPTPRSTLRDSSARVAKTQKTEKTMGWNDPEWRRAYMRAYRERNRDKLNAQMRAWHAVNKERVNEKKRACTDANREAVNTYKRQWVKAHPESRAATQAKRKEADRLSKIAHRNKFRAHYMWNNLRKRADQLGRPFGLTKEEVNQMLLETLVCPAICEAKFRNRSTCVSENGRTFCR